MWSVCSGYFLECVLSLELLYSWVWLISCLVQCALCRAGSGMASLLLLLAMNQIKVALSHYCCKTTLQCQCHETVLKLSIDRVRQPKQYSLELRYGLVCHMGTSWVGCKPCRHFLLWKVMLIWHISNTDHIACMIMWKLMEILMQEQRLPTKVTRVLGRYLWPGVKERMTGSDKGPHQHFFFPTCSFPPIDNI